MATRLNNIASTASLLLVFLSIGAMIVWALVAIPLAVWLDPDSEMAQRPQWSTLQLLAVKYQDDANGNGVIILPRAMRTSHTAIGLPRADRPQGYVWVIADPRGHPQIKAFPDQTPFRLKTYELHNIERRLSPSAELRAFLRQGVEP